MMVNTIDDKIAGMPQAFIDAFDEGLTSPDVVSLVDENVRRALYNLREVIKDEWRNSKGHYWIRDYRSAFQSAEDLGLVEWVGPYEGRHGYTKYIHSTEKGKAVFADLIRQDYDFALPPGARVGGDVD
ncbi:MAG: hypothetical protein AABX51_01860 [Nanoarchaeota archaeon]